MGFYISDAIYRKQYLNLSNTAPAVIVTEPVVADLPVVIGVKKLLPTHKRKSSHPVSFLPS